MFYLFEAVSLGGWLFIVTSVIRLFRSILEREQQDSSHPEHAKIYIRQLAQACFFIAALGTFLCGALAFVTGAPYLARFDTEGVNYLSATGWKRELWKDASKVALIAGTKQPIVRVYLPYYALDFDSQMFVHPKEVARTLQGEVERHKKRAST